MELVKQAWASTGASGGLTTVKLPQGVRDMALFISHSTLATTNSVSLQTAIDSTGPWFVEGSTQISTAASTTFKLPAQGPSGRWVRPYIHTASTGDYKFLFIGFD